MRKIILTVGIITLGLISETRAQVTNIDTTTNEPLNTAQNILLGNSGKKVTLGAYAQIDYNQPINDTAYSNGKMDVHRLVMFLGYKFNERVTFVSEIEMEHVKEVYVEQAFINYNITQSINFRGGLMLIPMGIINEYHEPTTFNGVERPNVDGKIVPTTWREMGAGFSGNIADISLKYQIYAVNGFKSFDGSGGLLRGSDALRKGRQKGAESTITTPNLSTKFDYYGIKGLKIGAAGYIGNTQSTAYNGVLKNDALAKSRADSTVVGLSMVGFDVRYNYRAFEARGQIIAASISNTNAYNSFTGKDVGSAALGYYGELGYDVLNLFKKDAEERIVVFGRYEFYDTHNSTSNLINKNDAYARTDMTFGISYHIANGAVLKGDYQIFDNEAKGSKPSSQLNFGVGVWF